MSVQGHYTYSGAYITQINSTGGGQYPDKKLQWKLIPVLQGMSE